MKGLWRGIFPTLYRDVPFSAIYWMSYESIKSFYNGATNVPSFGLSFVAGAISGSVSRIVCILYQRIFIWTINYKR